MGRKRSDKVSAHERRLYEPNLRTAFAYQVLYGVPVHELFPQVYNEVEQTLQKQARRLSERQAAQDATAKLLAKKGRLQQLAPLKAGEPAQIV